MIRKERKARWVYECEACGITSVSPDHFGAVEFGQHHERSLAHAYGVFNSAATDVVVAVRNEMDEFSRIIQRAMFGE